MYTVTEVAEILKLHRETVAEMLRTGRIKGVKIGKVWRVSQEELDKLMKGE